MDEAIESGYVPVDLVARFREEQQGRLHERVYRALRAAILQEQISPGTKITEASLLAVLDISRTPVREAFRLLEAEGLVTYSPSRGVVVRGLSREDLAEIYEVLEWLEPIAAQLAAKRIEITALQELEYRLQLMQFHAERGHWEEVTKEGIQFHRVVYNASGNSRLRSILLELREYVRGARARSLRSPSRGKTSVAEHAALYAAIAAHDEERAASVARQHVAASSHRVLASSSRAEVHSTRGGQSEETQE